MACLPYQSLDKQSASLSAADLHAVVMGDPFVGIVHPCKIYNILSLGIPFLYIGPAQSHIGDLIASLPADCAAWSAQHNDVEAVVNAIRVAAQQPAARPVPALGSGLSQNYLVAKMAALIESKKAAAAGAA
jgi:hypothetical protein